MGGWSQYALSPTMSIWVALSFDEYYLYTGDVLFLKEKAYPFFYEVGKAIMGKEWEIIFATLHLTGNI